MRKYVHRVGRTARAGKTGEAWTLVEEQEVSIFNSYLSSTVTLVSRIQARYFKQMLKEAGRLDKVKRLRISDEDLAPLTPHYEVRNMNIVNIYDRS
jgi:ATP-dependent RNA helicase DDX51/DBP6